MVFLRFMVVFILLTILANPRIKLSLCHASPTGITLGLVHRDHVASPQLSRAERLSQMVRRDMQRWNNINGIRRKTMEEDSATTTTISSGHDYGMNEYFVRLSVGTPPQVVNMIPDTGSDMNMFKCRRNRKGFSNGSFFNADNSTSFTSIPCDTSLCRNNLTYMVTRDPQAKPTCIGMTCAYSNFGYMDGSSTSGIFANETFTFTQPNKVVVKNMVIGCSTSGEKLETIDGAHGILGLGNSPLSFLALAYPTFGGNFAMCLVDHLSQVSASGIFVFGSVANNKEVLLPETMNYTTLDTTSLAGQGLYGLNVTGVYVNGTRVNVPSEAWDNMDLSGGMIVDTGTSFTFLNPLAYRPITNALNRILSGFMKPVVDNKSGFDYCYNSNGYDDIDPKLEIEFVGGVRLQPPSKSYLIDVVENSSSTKCLGFMPASAGYSTIGNILLQEHFLVFDVQNNMFGFGKSPCTSTT